MEQNLTIGRTNAARASLEFLTDKAHVCLVTGGASYKLCRAEDFVAETLRVCTKDLKITHLVVSDANPKVGAVQALLNKIVEPIVCVVAIGVGSVFDTA